MPIERIAKDRPAPTSGATIVPGNRVQLVPYNQFAWWNKYQFTPTWAAALGVIYFGDSLHPPTTACVSEFVRFDAAVYAKIDEMWRVQLNVENIFNKGYWATADGNNNISPGQPRTVRVTAFDEVLIGNRRTWSGFPGSTGTRPALRHLSSCRAQGWSALRDSRSAAS